MRATSTSYVFFFAQTSPLLNPPTPPPPPIAPVSSLSTPISNTNADTDANADANANANLYTQALEGLEEDTGPSYAAEPATLPVEPSIVPASAGPTGVDEYGLPVGPAPAAAQEVRL